MSTHGWFRYYRASKSPVGEEIIGAINRCGVSLEPARKCPPIGAGLVLFDRVDAETAQLPSPLQCRNRGENTDQKTS